LTGLCKNLPGYLTSLLVPLLTDYLRAVRKLVLDTAAQGRGREILGDVPGREADEDVHVKVDWICEELLSVLCLDAHQRYGLKFWIRSEHAPQGYGVGCELKEDADVECDVDPFDGTDQFLKGIQEAWWSVLTFSHNGVPLVGGAVDILGGVIYRSFNGRVERISTRSNRRELVVPRDETSLSGDSVVASYKGKGKYFFPWVKLVQNLFAQEHLAGVTHYGNGGSFVYALLAAGVLSAYIMDADPGEPISEISPGAGFVEAAGLCLLVVKGGSVRRLSALSGMEGRVKGIFIAACTEELARAIAEGLQGNLVSSRSKRLARVG